MNIEINSLDRMSSLYINNYRDPNKSYTDHELAHLSRVAKNTTLAGNAANFSVVEIVLARIAGWFHDFDRPMSESIEAKAKAEAISAKAASAFMEEFSSQGMEEFSVSQKKAVEYAVLNCGQMPAFFKEKQDPSDWSLEEKLTAALFTADKMEQNGVIAIGRRSQFLAGVRLRGPEADLPKFGLKPMQDANKAVLLESGIRIVFINPEGAYPPAFRSLTAKMYEPQREFIHGLLAAEGMHICDYAVLLLNTKLIEEPHLNYLEIRKIPPLTQRQLKRKLTADGSLSDKAIMQASEDLIKSAIEAVTYFSTNYLKPFEALVHFWHPQNKIAKAWHTQMVDYLV